jgi:hypothetical protein
VKPWLAVGALSLAAVILSHNLTAMMLIPFFALVALALLVFSKDKKTLITHYLLLITLALGLSAFYWLPALLEMDLTKVAGQLGGGANWRDHFVFADQLWASPWGFGGSTAGRLDGMSFMIGKLHLFFAALSLIVLLSGRLSFFRKVKKDQKAAMAIGVGFLALSIFLTNQISQPIWDIFKPMAYIQYPWRFLIFATFAASFLAGSATIWLKEFQKEFQDHPGLGRIFIPGSSWILGGLMVSALLGLNGKYFQPQYLEAVKAEDILSDENVKWTTSKISDEYLPKDFPVPQNRNEVAWGKLAVISGQAEVETLSFKAHRYDFSVRANTRAEVLLNTAYFPGWQVWVDGELVKPKIDRGKIKLTLSQGEHFLTSRFTNTPIRNVSNLVSLISFLGLLTLQFKLRRSKR